MIIHNPILTGSFTVNGTDVSSITSSAASLTSLNSYTASQNDRNGTYATTGSNTFAGIQTVNSNLVVTGSITAQTLVVQTITSSVDFVTGSTRFGSVIGNTHVFTGSVSISGSLNGTSATFTNNAASITLSNTSDVWLRIIRGSTFNNIGIDSVGAFYNTNGNHTFYVEDGTISALRINSTGNVGIGTTTPAGKLDISGGQYNTGLIVRTSSDNGAGLNLKCTDVGGHDWYVISTGTGNGGGAGNLGFYSGTNGNYLMYIKGSNGNVGIGTTNPSNKLHIAASSNPYIRIDDVGVGSEGGLIMQPTGYNPKGGLTLNFTNGEFKLFTGESGNGYFQTFYTNGTERMRITSGGVISINSSGAEANAGLDRFTMGYYMSNYGWLQTWASTPLYLNRLGNAVYAGTQRIDNNSDERIKENISPISNALNIVLALNGRKFNMLDEDNVLRYGFIAQEVQPHLSDFVKESDRSFEKGDIKIENLLTLESSGASWSALLVEAIKELKAEIEILKTK